MKDEKIIISYLQEKIDCNYKKNRVKIYRKDK